MWLEPEPVSDQNDIPSFQRQDAVLVFQKHCAALRHLLCQRMVGVRVEGNPLLERRALERKADHAFGAGVNRALGEFPFPSQQAT